MGLEFTGIGEPSATDPAVVGLDFAMLHHVSFKVACLGESLVANLAFVRPHTLMCQHVSMQVAELLEELAAPRTSMGFDAAVPQNVGNQIVLRCIGFLTHCALPTLLVPSNVHTIAVINLDVDINPLHLWSHIIIFLHLSTLHGLLLCFSPHLERTAVV